MLMRPPETLQNKYTAIRRKMDADYTSNQSLWQIQWVEATIDTRLEAGDTSLMGEILTTLPNNNRGSYYFNQVRPYLNMVSGQQIKTRKSTIAVPLENGDQKTADQWTKILLNVFKKDGIYSTISDAFHQGACVTGMNLLQVFMDWTNDPINGDIRVINCPYNEFFIDPYFRKLDLSDCSFVWKRSYMPHSAAAALMPDHYDDIMALPGNPTGMGRDGRFNFMPEAYGMAIQNKLAYDEYYYRDYRKQKLAVDKENGMQRDITDMEYVDIQAFLDDHGDRVAIIEQNIPTVRLAIAIQDIIFYDGPQPLLIDRYPFVPVVGYYNPMMPYFYSRIQGIARSLRDPQMLLNRRVVLNMDIAESIATSGYIFKENAPVDVKHLFQTGAGRIIPLKEEASMTDIMPIPPANIPPAYFQIEEGMQKMFSLTTGISAELMGMATDAKAGITEVLRQSAGLVTLEPLFSRLDRAQELLGDIMMAAISKNYTPFKISQILEGEQPSPLFYSENFGKYHCQVQDGFNTQSQRQMQLAQFVQLRELGVQIPDTEIIKVAPIQNKNELIEQMSQQAQQQMQMQQMQLQAQMAEQQARTELAQARTVADQGLGIERMSRVDENAALAQERKAAAEKDDVQALLNAIKAIKEIEDIDFTHLHKNIQLLKMLKELESNPLAAQNSSVVVDRGQQPLQPGPQVQGL